MLGTNTDKQLNIQWLVVIDNSTFCWAKLCMGNQLFTRQQEQIQPMNCRVVSGTQYDWKRKES